MSREQRQNEFSELHEKAEYFLEQNDLNPTPFPHSYRVIRLWQYPPLGDYVAWKVFKNLDNTHQIVVRQVRWLRLEDYQHFRDQTVGMEKDWHTDPTLVIRDQLLESQAFTTRMDTASKIRIPVLRPDTTDRGINIPRTTFGISYPNGGVRLTWRGDYPEEWSELIRWAAEMRTYLAQQFVESPDIPDET